MTKEQEKAILYLEYMNKNIDFNKIGYVYAKEMIETVLNMLKEKDREINSKNGTINALQCALKERTEERDRKDDIVTKQNKIIDLMADFIERTGAGRRAFSCTFRKNDECNENGCRHCIKQYFEEIAERKNENETK